MSIITIPAVRTKRPAISLKALKGMCVAMGDQATQKNPNITLVGCFYHERRKFIEAAKVSKKAGFAKYFIDTILQLSRIEKNIQTQKLDARATVAYRQAEAAPRLKKMKAKFIAYQPKVSSQSLLGKAIQYTLNQWPKLLNYLKDGRLDINNNRMERVIEPFAVGRKNGLFANSVAGAQADAIIYSLIETCKDHHVNPYDWLRQALTNLPSCQTIDDFEVLMPFKFKQQ